MIVRQLIAAAPTLIPVWAHRMIPDRPNRTGNPVFSVHQTDIIYYGCDLRDYFLHEFICKSELGLWPMPDPKTLNRSDIMLAPNRRVLSSFAAAQ